MSDRLKWLLEQLQRLEDNYAINTSWQSEFAGIKNEMADVVKHYVDAVAPPPAVIYQAMTAGDLETLTSGMAARVVYGLGDLVTMQGALEAEIHASDVTVLAAVNEVRTELLAAVAATAAVPA